jgi:hypothetical protein
LTEHLIPGIDRQRLQRLIDAGLSSVEDLVHAGPERLAEVTGFELATCRALVRVARSAMASSGPGGAVVELAQSRNEPGSVRLARGLSAARTIEEAVSVVRKARTHAGKRPQKASWARTHRRARRQLRKLLARLQQIQRSVLSDGLSETAHDHLSGEVDALQRAVAPILDRPIRKKVLRALRQVARDTRHALA